MSATQVESIPAMASNDTSDLEMTINRMRISEIQGIKLIIHCRPKDCLCTDSLVTKSPTRPQHHDRRQHHGSAAKSQIPAEVMKTILSLWDDYDVAGYMSNFELISAIKQDPLSYCQEPRSIDKPSKSPVSKEFQPMIGPLHRETSKDAGIMLNSIGSSPACNDENVMYPFEAQHFDLQRVKELNGKQLNNGRLSDIFGTSIKLANAQGQTALMMFVAKQDLEGVKYCSLFNSSGEASLFPALAEAALLQSEDIFDHLLEKSCLPFGDNGATERRHPFADRLVGDWKCLNPQLEQHCGCTLEQLLSDRPDRLRKLRSAMKTY